MYLASENATICEICGAMEATAVVFGVTGPVNWSAGVGEDDGNRSDKLVGEDGLFAGGFREGGGASPLPCWPPGNAMVASDMTVGKRDRVLAKLSQLSVYADDRQRADDKMGGDSKRKPARQGSQWQRTNGQKESGKPKRRFVEMDRDGRARGPLEIW